MCVPLLLGILASVVSADPMQLYVMNSQLNGTAARCNAETADFGPTELFTEISGIVVSASPSNGCLPLAPPPFKRNDSLVWVALVSRDPPDGRASCYFDQKVQNAEAAGYGAVLVQNYENFLISMHSSGSRHRVGIPAAMVTHNCGVVLRRYGFDHVGEKYRLLFREIFTFDLTIYVFCFIVIIAFCFVMFTVLWAVRLCRDWRRRQRNRLSKSNLKRLKVKKFEKGTDPFECCAICLEDFEVGEKLRILPCNHAYHCKCIDPWLLKSRSTCLICKRRVFPQQSGGSESGDADAADAEGAAAEVGASDNSERTPLLQSGGSGGSGTFDNPAVSLLDEQQSASTTQRAEDRPDAGEGGNVDVRVLVHGAQSHNRLV